MHRALKRAGEEKVQYNLRKNELEILYKELKQLIHLKEKMSKKLGQYVVFKKFMHEVRMP